MSKKESINPEVKYRKLILTLSVVLPLAVAALFGIKVEGYDLGFLPPIYATINGLTAVFLLLAVIAVKNKQIKLHQSLILTCVVLSVMFLLMYVLYHITSDTTYYGDYNLDGIVTGAEKTRAGFTRYIYYFILFTHILLSIAVIPMVLFTYVKGLARNVESHRKWAKKTFPLWMYVAVTGVIVYFMISPFYG